MKSKIVFADGDVPHGAMVMVRGTRASVAEPPMANARAAARRAWLREGGVIRSGQSFSAEMIEGLGARDLQALADGPIMDPSMLFLPAGKLSMAETREREAAQILSSEARP